MSEDRPSERPSDVARSSSGAPLTGRLARPMSEDRPSERPTDVACSSSIACTSNHAGADVSGHSPRPAMDEVLALLRRTGTVVRVRVEGTSMQPLLRPGDVVRVRTGERPRCGDIAVAAASDGLVVHRVVRCDEARAFLLGDNAARADDAIEYDRILGRVLAVEGDRLRRLDRGSARLTGLTIAAAVRVENTIGRFSPRPRPSRIVARHLTVADVVVPAPPDEDRLTLWLAAPRTAASRARDRCRGTLDPAEVDWIRLERRALLGQIGPQVYQGVRRLQPPLVPPETVRRRLRLQLFSNIARAKRIWALVDEILANLDEIGVPVMAHKGVALAACVYPDPALRIMGDIDLCVPDRDRARATRATRDLREALSRANPDRRDPNGYHVELDGSAHHDLDPPLFGGGKWRACSLDWDGIWARARPVPVGVRSVLVPCPTDLVLTLITNSLRRGFTPVRLIVDIAHTIDRFGPLIDWGSLQAELARTRLDRRSWIPLQLAATWCGAVVPVPLLEPPEDLPLNVFERAMIDWKHARPFARLPTRVLWSGDWGDAARVVARIGARSLTHAHQDRRDRPRARREGR